MRLDRFLWFARLAKTRSAAQALAERGTLRIDGRRIDRAHCPVRIGSVLAFAQHGEVRVLRIEALPVRRGPAPEAQALYTRLDGNAEGSAAKPVDATDPPQ
ncbi:RNA-binding S4 domain-containing protein [Sphingomonas japonica]|nr:S4 domain-containing protein [Sphingomonas japonica]